jgi:hypothetical protein
MNTTKNVILYDGTYGLTRKENCEIKTMQDAETIAKKLLNPYIKSPSERIVTWSNGLGTNFTIETIDNGDTHYSDVSVFIKDFLPLAAQQIAN